MTTWPARQAGPGREQLLLCGRQVDGRFVCQGVIGIAVENDTLMLSGMTEDPPGSGDWRPTARARAKDSEGRRAKTMRHETAGRFDTYLGWEADPLVMPLPWRRACPHCGCMAIVLYL